MNGMYDLRRSSITGKEEEQHSGQQWNLDRVKVGEIMRTDGVQQKPVVDNNTQKLDIIYSWFIAGYARERTTRRRRTRRPWGPPKCCRGMSGAGRCTWGLSSRLWSRQWGSPETEIGTSSHQWSHLPRQGSAWSHPCVAGTAQSDLPWTRDPCRRLCL